MMYGPFLYLQIAQDLEAVILSGRMVPGTRLPPVRTLARTYQVHVDTLQHALRMLRQAGLLQMHGRRTFVTGDIGHLRRRRAEKADTLVFALLCALLRLGCTPSDAIRTILELQEGG